MRGMSESKGSSATLRMEERAAGGAVLMRIGKGGEAEPMAGEPASEADVVLICGVASPGV